MVALVIGSLWLTEKTAAARLATTALGVSGAVAGTLVWVTGVGRDVDAFHGIAENTSTAAVGYEGYLAWAAAAAIVAPTTLYAVFLIKPPTLAVYRGAALKCLTLIAFWSFAAAGLRVTDYLIAVSLDLPHRIYDSFALTAFNVVTGCVAVWLKRQLAKGGLTSTVIAAFSGVLSVFTAAQLVIGVALAPRYADPVPRSPDAIYGNDLAQQLDQHVRRRGLRAELGDPGGCARHGTAGGLRVAAARHAGRGSDHRRFTASAEDGAEESFGSKRIRPGCSPRPLPRPRCGSSGDQWHRRIRTPPRRRRLRLPRQNINGPPLFWGRLVPGRHHSMTWAES